MADERPWPVDADGDGPGAEIAPVPDGRDRGDGCPVPRRAAQPPAPRKAKFGEAAELRPILPAHLQTLAAARKHYGWHLKRGRHHFLYHLVRLPARGWNTLRWAALGVLKIGWLQVNWWWLTEQTYLRMQAVASNDPRTWESLHKHAVKRRAFRGGVLAAELAALLVLVGTVTAYAPLAWLAIGAVVLPLLAWFGHPDDKPILTSATVPVAYETLSFEVIMRALEGLRLAGINQALAKDRASAIVLIDPIMRDGPGWLARLDLPHGVTAGDVSERREYLASGLRRQLGTVWPETIHKRHPGALALYVGDEDMTTADQPAWPLLRRGTTDVFAPVVFGTDPRGRCGHGHAHVREHHHRQHPEDGEDIPAAPAAADLRA